MKLTSLSLILATAALTATAQVHNMTFFKLPGLPGITVANSCSVNDQGTAAASVRFQQAGETREQAFQLRNNKIEILPDLPGYTSSIAYAINNKGEILGRMSGPNQFDVAVVVWKNNIPTRIALPPPSDPANRQLPSPIAIDNAGRILLVITELTPANNTASVNYYLLNGGSATQLPPLLPGGAVTAVFSYAYTAMNNSGDIAGYAMVTRLGQLQIIGFLFKNGAFQEVLVDQLFRVTGINQRGEIFGERNDLSFFVWSAGKTEIFPRLAASTLVQTSSFNNKGETCAWLRVFTEGQTGAFTENAIVTFNSKGLNH